jgi:hypothetical protein
LTTAEQRARVGDPELADTICHYQASFLGLEELRTHADAAGQAERWEAMADAATQYLANLDQRHEADWAGLLVRASLLLRNDDVLAAERARFDHIVVDDFESASFATNRLLTQLAGRGGNVTVAGNPDSLVWGHIGGNPSYLLRFGQRFGSVLDIALTESHRFPKDVDGAVADADAVADAEVVVSLEPGGDPWSAPAAAASSNHCPIPVALTTSLEWRRVAIVEPAADPADSAGASTGAGEQATYDLELLGGPDVPDAEARARRRAAEREARRALARSRARQTIVHPPSTAST